MSNKLKEIVKIIQARTSQNMDQVAKSIGYSRGHLSRVANEEDGNEESSAIEELLIAKYAEILQTVTLPEGHARRINKASFSPEQLFAMFLEVSKLQTGILQSIESKMARADAQARMETNLNRVFGGLETVAEIQDHAIKKILSDLNEIKAKIDGPSKG